MVSSCPATIYIFKATMASSIDLESASFDAHTLVLSCKKLLEAQSQPEALKDDRAGETGSANGYSVSEEACHAFADAMAADFAAVKASFTKEPVARRRDIPVKFANDSVELNFWCVLSLLTCAGDDYDALLRQRKPLRTADRELVPANGSLANAIDGMLGAALRGDTFNAKWMMDLPQKDVEKWFRIKREITLLPTKPKTKGAVSGMGKVETKVSALGL